MRVCVCVRVCVCLRVYVSAEGTRLEQAHHRFGAFAQPLVFVAHEGAELNVVNGAILQSVTPCVCVCACVCVCVCVRVHVCVCKCARQVWEYLHP